MMYTNNVENQELFLQIGFVGLISEQPSRRRKAKSFQFGFQAPTVKPKAKVNRGRNSR